MRRVATLPGWLVLAGAMLLGWVLMRRLPGAFRWRTERAAEEANRRLDVPLSPFKLAGRRLLNHRLTHDPEVLKAAEKYSREHGVPEAIAVGLAERYAREIVPAFDPYLYFRVGIPLAGWLSRALYRIDSVGDAELTPVAEAASVVFVMNHRSNMDYVILAHLLSNRAALSFAAGEWARVWPLGPFVRAMGAFFVRRGSGDELYRRVLERYVQLAVEGGLTLGIFLEGGLSRDGALQEPKIGLLDYMLRRFEAAGGRDVIFIPVAINYDWVLEDVSLVGSEAPRSSGSKLIVSTLLFAIRNLLVALRGRRRLGRAAVSFGAPVSVRQFIQSRGIDFRALDRAARTEQVKNLALNLMLGIGGILPIVPVPAIAHILVEAPHDLLPKPEIEARVQRLVSVLEERGARISPGGVEDGLRTLILRRLVLRKKEAYRPEPDGMMLLRYYANSISHLTTFR